MKGMDYDQQVKTNYEQGYHFNVEVNFFLGGSEGYEDSKQNTSYSIRYNERCFETSMDFYHQEISDFHCTVLCFCLFILVFGLFQICLNSSCKLLDILLKSISLNKIKNKISNKIFAMNPIQNVFSFSSRCLARYTLQP